MRAGSPCCSASASSMRCCSGPATCSSSTRVLGFALLALRRLGDRAPARPDRRVPALSGALRARARRMLLVRHRGRRRVRVRAVRGVERPRLRPRLVPRRGARDRAHLRLELHLAARPVHLRSPSTCRWRPASCSASSSAGAAGTSDRSRAPQRRGALAMARARAAAAAASRSASLPRSSCRDPEPARRPPSSSSTLARTIGRAALAAFYALTVAAPRVDRGVPRWLRPLRVRRPDAAQQLSAADRAGELRLLRLGPRLLGPRRTDARDAARDGALRAGPAAAQPLVAGALSLRADRVRVAPLHLRPGARREAEALGDAARTRCAAPPGRGPRC